MFEHDIALSFAGEQRSQVEEIATCLIAAGARVFYDKFVKAELWGKDLYQHLSDVYRNRARYCIIFISKEYAEKAWTTHELKAAQARAFAEKGAEYILPVRFDDTEVADILPTIGFLDFRTDGPAAICAAALEKLGKTVGTSDRAGGNESSVAPISCDFSPRALIICKQLNLTIFPVISESAWGDEIKLSVDVDDKETDAILTRLRNNQNEMLVAYGFSVAQARLQSAVRNTLRGTATWKLIFASNKTDFRDDYELNTPRTTSDQFAEKRARRLLLNEFPAKVRDQRGDTLGFLNDATDEGLIRGLQPIISIEKSIFLELFKELGQSKQAFIEAAWILAVASLQLSSAVEHIDLLKLQLAGNLLGVQFRGQRHKRYSNVEAYRIDISGELLLTR